MSSNGPTGIDRFAEHGRSLEELSRELGSSRTPRERAALAGRLLSVVGDLGRRQKAMPRPGVERALRALKREDLEGWLQAADARGMQAELARASESAMEALLADTEDERREYATWVLEALARRDGLESALTALERWEAMGNALGAEAKRGRERLLQELSQAEAKRQSLVRQFLSVNEARRDERERLDPEQRERAWWYSQRAECPAPAFAASESKSSVPAEPHCAECRADAEKAKLAAGPAEQPSMDREAHPKLYRVRRRVTRPVRGGRTSPARSRDAQGSAVGRPRASASAGGVQGPAFSRSPARPARGRAGEGSPHRGGSR